MKVESTNIPLDCVEHEHEVEGPHYVVKIFLTPGMTKIDVEAHGVRSDDDTMQMVMLEAALDLSEAIKKNIVETAP